MSRERPGITVYCAYVLRRVSSGSREAVRSGLGLEQEVGVIKKVGAANQGPAASIIKTEVD